MQKGGTATCLCVNINRLRVAVGGGGWMRDGWMEGCRGGVAAVNGSKRVDLHVKGGFSI